MRVNESERFGPHRVIARHARIEFARLVQPVLRFRLEPILLLPQSPLFIRVTRHVKRIRITSAIQDVLCALKVLPSLCHGSERAFPKIEGAQSPQGVVPAQTIATRVDSLEVGALRLSEIRFRGDSDARIMYSEELTLSGIWEARCLAVSR